MVTKPKVKCADSTHHFFNHILEILRILNFSTNYPTLSNFSNYLSLTEGCDISCQDEDEGFLAPSAREKPEA